MLSGCLWNPHPSGSFSPHCSHCPHPTSLFSPPQGLVPAVWTEAHGVGSPALCAGSPGSSRPPSELRTGSSTLHTSARPEPGTAEGVFRQEEGALGVPRSCAAGSHAAQSHPRVPAPRITQHPCTCVLCSCCSALIFSSSTFCSDSLAFCS